MSRSHIQVAVRSLSSHRSDSMNGPADLPNKDQSPYQSDGPFFWIELDSGAFESREYWKTEESWKR